MTIRAARYLGVPAWELADGPLRWQERAVLAMECEAIVEREAERRANRKTRRAR